MNKRNPRILMVCLGNICRSPMAEGVLRHLSESTGTELEIDSAGTGGWHVGESPDDRATANLLAKGIDISGLRARQFSREDFNRFDLILTMDQSNYSNVVAVATTPEEEARVRPILDYGFPGQGLEVPDPYYGGSEGFEHVYDLLLTSCQALVEEVSP